MTRVRISWARLVRAGLPEMVVIRKPLAVGEKTLSVGEQYPSPLDRHAETRCRQLYEMRRIGVAAAEQGVEKKRAKKEKGNTNGNSKK